MNTLYGDQLAVLKDFSGNQWSIASRIEDITLAEVQRRVSGFGGQSQRRRREFRTGLILFVRPLSLFCGAIDHFGAVVP
jgi:hypothetical protein